MANIDSSTLNKNDFMDAFGNAVQLDGKVSLTVNPTAADVIRVMKIPAGTKVSKLVVANDTLDSNGVPTLVASIGYAPVNAADGPAANAAYFAAAGQTTLRTAQDGKAYGKFDAISFEKDVYLTITVGTASATFAAGSIWATVQGEARGIK